MIQSNSRGLSATADGPRQDRRQLDSQLAALLERALNP